MTNFNKVILAGRLTRDVEARTTQSGMKVASFGLAINGRKKTATGEWEDETTFVDVTCFNQTADQVERYLAKGRSVLIDGRLRLDQWTDQQGQKRQKLVVIADRVEFLDSPKSSDAGDDRSPEPARRPSDSEQIPF